MKEVNVMYKSLYDYEVKKNQVLQELMDVTELQEFNNRMKLEELEKEIERLKLKQQGLVKLLDRKEFENNILKMGQSDSND